MPLIPETSQVLTAGIPAVKTQYGVENRGQTPLRLTTGDAGIPASVATEGKPGSGPFNLQEFGTSAFQTRKSCGENRGQPPLTHKTLARRNDALSRVAAVLGEAAKPPVSRDNLARKCRFDAADRLLNEARAAHAAAEAALAEIAVLGPIVNKPVPRME
jgi:hypothetical protein